jgi:putative ABC transport system permease protein
MSLLYTFRQLRRAPFYTVTVLLTLTLAIGAAAAMAGVLRATLLNPLPYPYSEQLVNLTDENLRGIKSGGLMSVLRTADLASLEHNGHKLFASVAYFYYNDGKLTLDGHEPVPAAGAAVSGDFFKTIGAAPRLGRTLNTADDQLNAPVTIVLSDHLWRSTFAGDPHILGRTLRLGDQQATVVGVMQPSFDYPANIDLWYPGHVLPANFGGYRGDNSRFVNTIGRLAEGETLQSATQQTALLAEHLAATYPGTDAAWGFGVVSLRDTLFGSIRKALILLSAAIGLVLLVTAMNLAGLQLSRNAARQPEFAIRSALGISRGRLVRQLLSESIMLVLAGGLGGVALGSLLLKLFAAQLPAEVLSTGTPHVDAYVIAIMVGIALAVGIATGLVPAVQATRSIVPSTGTRTLAQGTRRFGRLFTAVQIALALVLLTLSAGVLEGLYRLLHTPLGFNPEQLQTFTIDLPWTSPIPSRHPFYKQVESQLSSLPGVTAVGSITALPLATFSTRVTFDIAGQPPTPQHDTVVAEGRGFTPGYLRAMQIPLLAGRAFTQQDAEPGTPGVLLVNQAFVRRYFPGKNPVGQRLTSMAGYVNPALVSNEIVGVIGDVQGTGGTLTATPQPEVYTAGDGGWPHMQFALRSSLPASELEPTIRRMVTGLNASASVSHLVALSSTIDRTLAQPRLNAELLTAFAGLSLLLVAIGVYGLVAFDVAQRTRELGLRLALGSSRAGILSLLLAESSRVLAAGVMLGVAASLGASKLLASSIAGPQTQPALLLALSSAVLAVAVLSATLLPAVRAAAGDPMEALRTD